MSAALVKELRERTGSGIMDCRRALDEAGGDLEKAAELLRQKGLASADKKRGRTAAEGLIASYIHNNGRYGALVEINCETDFVARTDDFQQLVSDIALHIVGMRPRYTSEDEISDDERQAGIKEFGDEKRFIEETVLLRQGFVKDPGTTVEEVVRDAIGKLGENIVIRRFARFELGETVEDDESGEGA